MLGPFCLLFGSHLSWHLKTISGKVFYISYLKHLYVMPFHFNWFTIALDDGAWLLLGFFSFYCFVFFLKMSNTNSYCYYLYFYYLFSAIICNPYCPVPSSETHSLLSFPLTRKHWNDQQWLITRASSSLWNQFFWACSTENYSKDRGPKEIP